MIDFIQFIVGFRSSLGLADRDYMQDRPPSEPPPERPRTIVIVGGLLALGAFALVVFGR